MARRALTVAVAGETAGDEVETRLARGDQRQHQCTQHRADHLSDDVRQQVASGKAAGDGQADAHRRIQVAAGDMADRIGHGQDSEAERERNAHEADTQTVDRAGEASGEDGAAAASEHEPEGAEQLGRKAL